MSLGRNLKTETVGQLRPGAALTVAPTDKISAAIALMQQRHVGCLLVCNDKKLVGVFTERDLITRVLNVGRPFSDPVSEVMTSNPVTVTPNDSIRRALSRMEKGGYRHLPVLDDMERVVGILSVKRLVHYLAENFPATVYNQPPDNGVYPRHRGGA
jgi:CBS domain-containing protein